jgi:hypothetical protein
MAVAMTWARSRPSSSLYGLGADGDATSPATRVAAQRRFLAKKFWGTTVLTSEARESMTKLARRVNWYDKSMSTRAASLADKLALLAKEAVDLANDNDSAWVAQKLTHVNRVSA